MRKLVAESAAVGWPCGMNYAADDFDTLPRMPPWVTSARTETPEDVVFLSDAALGNLQLVVGRIEAAPGPASGATGIAGG
ncbi:MAG: hypothetical protein ABJH07_08070 [Sedimentitalea sp.]|uniref:hypothetical protein n=1 Tax=Sedimentitalea sp. TaxID=2048915 RepID=UPI003262D745